MTLLTNKKFIVFVIVFTVGFLIYLWIVFNSTNSLFGTPAGRILSGGVFSKVSPGKTTEQGVIDLYGKPDVTEENNGLRKLLYDNPSQQQYERVWTKDGKVVATKEYLPEDSKTINFTNSLGSADISLYDKSITPARWLVYLDEGIAIRVFEDQAYVFARFTPQSKDSFMKNVASVVGITTKKPEEAAEPIIKMTTPTPESE